MFFKMKHVSRYSKVKSLIVYGLCTVVLIVSLSNFNENRVLFSILIMLLVFFYWITGFYDEVVVTDSELKISNAHLIPVFRKNKCYPFDIIDLITIEAKYRSKDYFYYQYLSSQLPGFFLTTNCISIQFKDGSHKNHITQLSQQQLDNISTFLKRESKDCIKIKMLYS